MSTIITLTTDFGTTDGYVAAMKGVILSMAPEVTIVDGTHEIEPQVVRQAAVAIYTFASYFPAGTIHVVVVDPGVGTKRAILAVEALDQIFMAPDNGLLSLIFDSDPPARVFRVENRVLFRPEVSATFHGRDIFAPVAAHLASGVRLEDVGPQTDQYVRGLIPKPEVFGESIIGQVIYRDRFGNLMTNITLEHLKGLDFARVKVKVGNLELHGIFSTYGEVEKGQPLALLVSSGFLEIAVREGDAGKLFNLVVGGVVVVGIYK
jgi:S-adenosylmethionine hydrolase